MAKRKKKKRYNPMDRLLDTTIDTSRVAIISRVGFGIAKGL
jgi:hypothetical protein